MPDVVKGFSLLTVISVILLTTIFFSEFLNSYIVDGKAVSLQPRGLLNQSNYCYINSILQALTGCPPLYNLLSGLAQNVSSNEKRKPTPVIDAM